MPKSITCQYCGRKAEQVAGADIYGPMCGDLAAKRFYACVPCGAWVGSHADGRPLGSVAKAALRERRHSAHVAFDPLWRDGVFADRKTAYRWLAGVIGVDEKDCHIARMDEAQCDEVVNASLLRQHEEIVSRACLTVTGVLQAPLEVEE